MTRNIAAVKALISKLIAANLTFHGLNKKAERQLGLSLVQYHFLQLLRDRPGCSPQLLAQLAGQHPSTVTPSLKRLARKGLVHVNLDPKDSRKKSLTLTLDGFTVVKRFESGIHHVMSGLNLKDQRLVLSTEDSDVDHPV